MKLSADVGRTMAVYTAEPGSPSQGALKLLASWAATLDQAEAANRIDGLWPAAAEPLADPGYGTEFTGHGTMVVPRLGVGRKQPSWIRRKVLGPVTKQATTAPGHGRRSATQSDIRDPLNCGNRTQPDVIGRNRHAW